MFLLYTQKLRDSTSMVGRVSNYLKVKKEKGFFEGIFHKNRFEVKKFTKK